MLAASPTVGHAPLRNSATVRPLRPTTWQPNARPDMVDAEVPVGPKISRGASDLRSRDRHRLADDAVVACWQRHWSVGSNESRNRLALIYRPLTGVVVRLLPGDVRNNVEICDLESFGLFGLYQAIDRFAEGSEVLRFPSYAKQRIRGAIFDELRQLDWLPRLARRRVIEYRTTVETLTHSLGRSPRSAEVIAAMDLGAEQGDRMRMEVQSAQLLRVGTGTGADNEKRDLALLRDLCADGDGEPESVAVASALTRELRRVVAELPERQRKVIELRFFERLTQLEVGLQLGVSNSRVSQMETSALASLRHAIEQRGW
jgi:RNA polymerase sigma factor for flagellar operon FliA